MKIIVASFIVYLLLINTGCSIHLVVPSTTTTNSSSRNPNMVTLYSGGYGYEIGDIVLVDKQKEPNVGDMILYDIHLNKSDCGVMGPGIYLAKIIGLSEYKVNFYQQSYEVNGITFKRTDSGHIISLCLCTAVCFASPPATLPQDHEINLCVLTSPSPPFYFLEQGY